jgi:protocatechuate 3,4-dioxygenase beta subunit
MSKRLIVIALAAAGSLALVGWFALGAGSVRGRGSAGGARAADRARAAPANAGEGRELAAPVVPVAHEEAEAAVIPVAAAASARESSKRSSAYEDELAKARWVEGRLVFPAGTPADEKVFLTAKGRDFEHGPEHKVEVPPGGAFRLAFSERTRRGSVQLEARYLYLESSARIDFDDPSTPLVLEPALGGRLQGRLVLPEDGKLTLPGLADASVNLHRMTRRGNTSWNEQMRNAKIEGTTFEFAGLPSGGEYRLDLAAEAAYAQANENVAVQPGKTSEVVLAVHAGATIEGHVRDEQGEPLAEIDVLVHAEGSAGRTSVMRHVTSDAEGAYRVRGLPPGDVSVQVDEPGYEEVERELALRADGEVLSGIDLVLRRGFQISGRVRWPDGSPAARATVEFRSASSFDWFEKDFTSEEDGSFVASGLEDASYRVEARGTHTVEVREPSPITGKERTRKKRTVWRSTASDVRAGTSGLELVLDPGFVLAGVVRDDLGRPLDEFEVQAIPSEGRPASFNQHFQGWANTDWLYKSFKDAGGSFELPGFTPGPWSIAAKAKGHSASAAVALDAPDELGTFVELVVPRAGRIEGIVVDAGGRGIPGAEVSWVEGGSRPFHFGGDDVVDTDGAGRFVIEEVTPGSLQLQATSDVAAPSAPVAVEIEPGGFLANVELQLRRGGRITGQVVDARGTGVASHEVDLWGSDGGGNRETLTDAEGRFAFENLGAGNYRVSSDPTPEEVAEVAAGPGQDVDQLLERQADVELPEEGSADVLLAPPELHPVVLHGNVTAARKPLANAHIWSWGESERHASTETEDDGSYELMLPAPGHYNLQVRSMESGLQSSVELDVPEVARFAFDIAIASGSVSGRVLDPDGEPLSGVAVSAAPTSVPAFGWSPSGGETTSGADGTFRLDVPAGTYDLVAGMDAPWQRAGTGFAPGRVRGIAIAAEREVRGIELTLRHGGAIEGTVKLADGGPLSMAWVQVVGADGEIAGVQGTDATGVFRVEGIEPGDLRIQATDQQEHVTGWFPVEVRVGETTRIDLELVTGTTLRAHVLDASGTSIEAESVELRDARGNLIQAGWWTDGSYWLGSVPSGKYVVRATRLGRTVERAATVAGEEELTVELRFD